ncbi:hypothetical protein [Sodalis ligni]|uniref:Uncharacterized protein n=1 Tax=Sodalis ligni TaxID=2697027 RepID=A0A4R1N7N5_9GAMM|nr:hypothetical protein [Sodalis ligni]TCL03182.1 hypothetical protein EZJ58_1234 [Sodalis ligni]
MEPQRGSLPATAWKTGPLPINAPAHNSGIPPVYSWAAASVRFSGNR